MFDSPLSASAYEILEVDPSVDDAELRRAYRLRMRQTHPDTGGDAAMFVQVQRAWELIGTPEGRAAYDRRTGVSDAGAGAEWSGWRPPTAARTDSRPRARSYGHPGGWRRERYLVLIREWAGRGVNVNAIAPGYFHTEATSALIKDRKRYQSIRDRIPAGRWGETKELKGAFIFLASPASDYVHGHILCVDGGYLAR